MKYIAFLELALIIAVCVLIAIKRSKNRSDWWLLFFFAILALNDAFNVLNSDTELHIIHIATITFCPAAFRLHLITLSRTASNRLTILFLVPVVLLIPFTWVYINCPQAFLARFYLFSVILILIVHGVIAIVQSNSTSGLGENKDQWSKWFSWCFTLFFTISFLSSISIDDSQDIQNRAYDIVNDVLSLVTILIITWKGYQYGILYPIENKWKNSELKDQEKAFFDNVFKKIDQLIDREKLYLKNDLTQVDICQLLSINQKYVSQAVNLIYGCSFNQYINEKRIAEFEKKLREPQFQNYSIAALSNECGFSSASSFNRIFKTIKRITPSEYKRINL